MLTFQDLTDIEGNGRTSRPIWNYAAGTLTPWKGNPNCGKVRTDASCKITGTWESFNNQGTKTSLLSETQLLTANNSNNFPRNFPFGRERSCL